MSKALIGHFVVSMPDNLALWIHGWNPEKALAMVYEICRRHRVCGGIVIFHPWRRDEDFEYTPDGYWHFHVIGLHFIPTSPGGSDYAPDGSPIVFKHIKDDEYENYGGLRSGLAIARVIQYQLTHAGLREGRQALTYFGLLHHSKIPKEKVQTTYPECLEEDSKTSPEVPGICPVCGSCDTETCIVNEPIIVHSRLDDEDHCIGTEQKMLYPEPNYEPTPELVEAAEVALEEQFQNRYDNESDPAERHKLTKERQRARARLARRELELFNIKNPLVEIWVWLQAALSGGAVSRDRLRAEDPDLLDQCIELNLKTGRLGVMAGGRLYLEHEYGLDDALREVRDIVRSGEPSTGQDVRLERLVRVTSSPLYPGPSEYVNPILTDDGFVFGDLMDRLIATNTLVASSHPDRNLYDASIENGVSDFEE
jgi:hypothetical protein